jgi:hypothetical protein
LKTLENHFKSKKKFNSNHFETSNLYIGYALIYFGVWQYEDALKYINLLLSQPKSNERQEFQIFARIINLIIHYELGNVILLDSLLRSTHRFLKKQQQIYPYEKLIVDFITLSIKIANKSELKEAFLNLKNSLEELQQNSTNLVLLHFSYIRAWVDSHITLQPFEKLVQEAYKKSIQQNDK